MATNIVLTAKQPIELYTMAQAMAAKVDAAPTVTTAADGMHPMARQPARDMSSAQAVVEALSVDGVSPIASQLLNIDGDSLRASILASVAKDAIEVVVEAKAVKVNSTCIAESALATAEEDKFEQDKLRAKPPASATNSVHVVATQAVAPFVKAASVSTRGRFDGGTDEVRALEAMAAQVDVAQAVTTTADGMHPRARQPARDMSSAQAVAKVAFADKLSVDTR